MRRIVAVAVVTLCVTTLGVGTAHAQRTAGASRHLGAKKPKVPKKPCTLLTSTEVGAVIPAADAGTSVDLSGGGQKQRRCTWADEAGTSSLTTSATSLPADTPPSLAKQILRSERGAKKVSVGDFAVVISSKNDVYVQALVGRVQLDVDFNASGARDQQAAVISLAKAAAKRL